MIREWFSTIIMSLCCPGIKPFSKCCTTEMRGFWNLGSHSPGSTGTQWWVDSELEGSYQHTGTHTHTGPCFKVYANNGSLHPHLMNTMNVSTAFGSTASGETLIKARTNLRGIPSKASNGQDILSTSKQTMAPSPQTRSRSSWSKFTMKLQLNCEKKNLFGGRDWCERRNLHDPWINRKPSRFWQ